MHHAEQPAPSTLKGHTSRRGEQRGVRVDEGRSLAQPRHVVGRTDCDERAVPARIVHRLGGKRFDCDAPIRRPGRDTPGRPRETGSSDHRSRCADSLGTRRSHAHVHQFPPPSLVQRLTAPCGSGPRRSSGARCFRQPVRPRTAQRAPDTEVPRALSRVDAQLLGPPTTTAASSAPHPDVVHREQFDRCLRCLQPPHRRHGRRDSCPAAQRLDARMDTTVGYAPAVPGAGGRSTAHPPIAEHVAAGSVVAGPRTYDPLRSVRTSGP